MPYAAELPSHERLINPHHNRNPMMSRRCRVETVGNFDDEASVLPRLSCRRAGGKTSLFLFILCRDADRLIAIPLILELRRRDDFGVRGVREGENSAAVAAVVFEALASGKTPRFDLDDECFFIAFRKSTGARLRRRSALA